MIEDQTWVSNLRRRETRDESSAILSPSMHHAKKKETELKASLSVESLYVMLPSESIQYDPKAILPSELSGHGIIT
jgi:hypothetical protein